ncbi:MAG: WD40 repeat domain-containing protein, partial [Bdellovibrio bacteriovorus]
PTAVEHDPSNVQAAALTRAPDGGDLVATGNDAGTLQLMRRAPDGTWTRLCRLQLSPRPVMDLAFAPDGRALAAASEDGRAALVAISAGACGEPRYLDAGATTLYSVAFAPDGKTLVTASLDARAQVWGTDGRLLANLVGHKDRIYSAEFSPDGRWLLTASRDGAVRVWEHPGSAGARVQSEVPRAEGPGTADATPAQGSYLVLDGKLGGVAYARFSPDGHSIAAAYWENAAVLWRLWTEDPTAVPAQEAIWGRDRARLTLIREAYRFRDNIGVRTPRASRQTEPQ